jgi:hypothetical protein
MMMMFISHLNLNSRNANIVCAPLQNDVHLIFWLISSNGQKYGLDKSLESFRQWFVQMCDPLKSIIEATKRVEDCYGML